MQKNEMSPALDS